MKPVRYVHRPDSMDKLFDIVNLEIWATDNQDVQAMGVMSVYEGLFILSWRCDENMRTIYQSTDAWHPCNL